jgi:hypothetical protein
MREDMRTSQDAKTELPEALSQQYDSLLDEGVRLAHEFASAEKRKKPGLARMADRVFAKRVTILRQLHRFPTLDETMPALHAIAVRRDEEDASWNAERIADAFNFDDGRPAHVKMNEATDAHRRLFGIESHEPALNAREMREFKLARRSALEAIGARFVFGSERAQYTNLLSFVKDDLVVHLTQDALPAKGLPNAERISGMSILTYVNGQAQEHVAYYHRGKWDERAVDGNVQRIIDEIAAAVG